ncbi:MAG: HPP family protein [Pseudomonadales bacterium]|nr:HPP family protein [Pseudomonadales bacterium]
MKTDRRHKGDIPTPKQLAITWLGAFITIAALALLADFSQATLMLGSFGASCVLIFGFPTSAFSQPRNVIFGHFFSSLIGLICLHFLGNEWWSLALAVSTAIAFMMASGTVHPPAGSNPVIVFLSLAHWDFLLMPTLLGSLILVGSALIYNNLGNKYPVYW